MTRPGPQARIAVIIPTWNAQSTLRRAATSALAQDRVDVEVVIVDDASVDGTLDCARTLAAEDDRVQVLSQPENRGPAAARNRALEHISAPYVTPLDSDDFMEPDRLAQLLQIAEQGDWDFVADDLLKVPESDVDGPRTRLWSQTDIGLQTLDFSGFVRGNLSSRHGGRRELGFLKPLISTAFLNRTGLRYDADMRLGEDYMLYASALSQGARFCLTDPAGYVAVTRPTSLSGQHSARDLGALVQADRTLMARTDLSAGDRAALREHYIETLKKWHWFRMIDAVKARDPVDALRCFYAPPAVIGDLLGKLGEQVLIRGSARLPFLASTDRMKDTGEKGENP
ncbi:glycosyltransferase family 2 protein [Ruegeria sp. 2205SS24-7]|uniref:glycosyltransferase family 2 protein n=1 Tax=Ruegeria discodermiae TaxID=3064389 RepID=UPI002742472C|nr:glycosyltransferase family 2 protein [Ruegeria sp. 2205SS24-7]MDP5220854.1 glycosyltransferase family 2 protein [Ruegeria sp. 2205SS24-7]